MIKVKQVKGLHQHFFLVFAHFFVSCKTKDSSFNSESSIESSGNTAHSDASASLVISKAVDQTLKSAGLDNIFEVDQQLEVQSFGRTSNYRRYFNGNILSTKTGHCLGVKERTRELQVTDSDDHKNAKCARVYLYGKMRNPGGLSAPQIDYSIIRFVFSHNGKFYCLQSNGLSERATLEPCLAQDPGNIQTFDWDTGKGWGLIRQSGDKSKALCLDIENEDRYEKVNFFNCTMTAIDGKGKHQRFWFRKYEFPNSHKTFNFLEIVD